MKQGLTYTVIFTFIFCFLFVFILAFVNQSTRAYVLANQELAFKRTLLSSLDIEASTDQDVQERYAELERLPIGDTILYRASIDNSVIYAKQFSGAGLWGTISGILAVTEDLSQVVNMRVIAHNETPGLGGRIDEEWFQEQLSGERIVDLEIDVTKANPGDPGDSDKTNGEIDAITGATRTSDAIAVILYDELQLISSAIRGGL